MIQNLDDSLPENSQPTPGRIDRLGRFGLLIFSFSAWFSTSGANIGLTLMGAAILLEAPRLWASLKRDFLFWWSLSFCAYVAWRAMVAAREFPQLQEVQWDFALRWASLWLFLVVAWWLGGRIQLILKVLGLSVVGLILGVVRKGDWSLWQDWLGGMRYDFGFPPLGLGFLSGACLMGLLFMAPHVLCFGRKRWTRIASAAVWFFSLIFLIQVCITTQTRAVWLCLLLLLPPFAVLRFLPQMKRWRDLEWKPILLISAPCAALMGLVVYYQVGTFEARFKQVSQGGSTFSALMNRDFDIDRMPWDALGIRMHLNRFGIQEWLQRPLFGWGPGTSGTKFLLTRGGSTVSDAVEAAHIAEWAHLHSCYIEALVRLGIVGALFYLVGALCLFRSLWRSYRLGSMPSDLFLFSLCALLYAAIFNLSDFRVVRVDFRYFFLLMGGVIYTFPMFIDGYSIKRS